MRLQFIILFKKEKKTYKTKKWYVCISFEIRKNTPNWSLNSINIQALHNWLEHIQFSPFYIMHFLIIFFGARTVLDFWVFNLWKRDKKIWQIFTDEIGGKHWNNMYTLWQNKNIFVQFRSVIHVLHSLSSIVFSDFQEG